MRVIPGGIAAFNGSMYGQHDQATLNFFQNQIKDFSGLSGSVYAERFARDLNHYYDQHYGLEAQRAALLAKEYSDNINQVDLISWLQDLHQLQAANNTMQRYIMANPYVRNEWQNQRCDGYSNTYVDMHPGKIGDNHYDYVRAIEGIVMDTKDEDGNDAWQYTYLCDPLQHGEAELTLRDQKNILNTWQIAELIMRKRKDDPTSQEGGQL